MVKENVLSLWRRLCKQMGPIGERFFDHVNLALYTELLTD